MPLYRKMSTNGTSLRSLRAHLRFFRRPARVTGARTGMFALQKNLTCARSLLNKLLSVEIICYFLLAGVAASVNFTSRFIYDLFLDFRYSVVFAYSSGMLVSFVLSKRYIFSVRESGRTHTEFIKFTLTATVGLIVTCFVSVGMLGFIHSRTHLHEGEKVISHICGIGAGFIANYFGHKFFSFRETGLARRI